MADPTSSSLLVNNYSSSLGEITHAGKSVTIHVMLHSTANYCQGHDYLGFTRCIIFARHQNEYKRRQQLAIIVIVATVT